MRRDQRPDRVGTPITRRAFLGQAGIAAGVGAAAWLAYSDQPMRRREAPPLVLRDFRTPILTTLPTLALARGPSPERLVRAVVDRLGGMGRFIGKGETVLLKPNIGWDRQPEQAANTNPTVVASVVTLCREAGAARVWVADGSINDPHRCLVRSGIRDAVLAAGGEIHVPGRDSYRDTALGGKLLTTWPVMGLLHEVDRVINLPVVKHHSLSGCTLAMKNWYGVIGGQRNQLHQDIHLSIVDLAGAFRPTLTILDAVRVLKRNGPTGGNLEDVAVENTVMAGLDEVALDAMALRLLDLEPEQVPYLALAATRGLGRVDWRALPMAEIQTG